MAAMSSLQQHRNIGIGVAFINKRSNNTSAAWHRRLASSMRNIVA